MTLAGRYLPAASAQLGGDWYDAFQLPDGRLGMAIGDVVGRGFHAAAVMGQLRSGLRAYALDGIAPSDVLERLSRLLRQLDPGGTATVLYLVLDPYAGSLVVSSAGHPPPLVMSDRRRRRTSSNCPGRRLSAPRATRSTRSASTTSGRDPLSSSTRTGWWSAPASRWTRGSSGSGWPSRRARTTSSTSATAWSTSCCQRGQARTTPRSCWDVRCRSADSLLTRLPADVDSIPLMRRLLGRWLHEAGATQADVEDLSLATSEACANAIEHAYGPAPGILELSATKVDERRRPCRRPRLRQLAAARAAQNRGRGLLLMEGLTDSVEVVRGDDGTTVQLSRRLGAEAA